jgi:phosphoadenosine phosphosulfate reductase
VLYNELLDMGYKSIGDWHSTALPGSGDGERSGRWKDKGGKTECGLHKDYFKFKKVAEKKMREAELARRDEARDKAEATAEGAEVAAATATTA